MNKKVLTITITLGLALSGCGSSEGSSGAKDVSSSAAVQESSLAESDPAPEDSTSLLPAANEIKESLENGNVISAVSGSVYKTAASANPISPSVFCADPTAVEYNGRLYIYGTNDHQQSEEDTTNDYDHIKSFVVFSTDDMVNWIYHGRIETGEIAPWITNSWAPSVVSRVEEDGLTHFYLYFSNNGNGVGVLTSTDPVGPWSDPLGKPLVYQNMPGLENCPAPFDPGVCIDENGTGWLAFGGGAPADGGEIHSNIPKVVKLGADMLSFDSEFVSIDAPYFFEASELNYIDGVYYYTYCSDWQTRGRGWDYENAERPPRCSMAYLTTRTPLDAASWEFKGGYFYNSGENAEGESGLRWGNNHTHFCTYNGVNYILHHTLLLEELEGGSAGFRSIMADYLPMDSAAQRIPLTAATRKGVAQIKAVDAYSRQSGALMFTSADVFYDKVKDPAAKSMADGAWIMVKGVDFEYGAKRFAANVKGKGRIEVRLDDPESEAIAHIDFDNADTGWVGSTDAAGFDGRLHNVYLVFSGSGIELADWYFEKNEEPARAAEELTVTDIDADMMIISGQAENPGSSIKAQLEFTKSGDYSLKSSDFDAGSEVLNLGFINTDKDAQYTVHMNSLTLQTEGGDVTIPVDLELDPASANKNGLANGWGGAAVGDLIYGSEQAGLYAEETSVSWIGYRIALKQNGTEVPFTSITYNLTLTVNE